MRDRQEVEMIKKMFPVGTRIRLKSMNDNYAISGGVCGTVDYVDDEGQIGMKWDDGRTLALIYGEDQFEIIKNRNKDFER